METTTNTTPAANPFAGALGASHNSHDLSRQWASRPDDQRFLTLAALRESVAARTARSHSAEVPHSSLVIDVDEAADDVFIRSPRGSRVDLTNWSFGQIASAAKAPASYLRRLPAPLAAANLINGLGAEDTRESHLAYTISQGPGRSVLRALTSPSYGRILDLDIVDRVLALNAAQGDRWVVPASTTTKAGEPTKRSTTLYASDRDVYLFLCDPSTPVEVDGETLLRGFIVSNSETGAQTFNLATFLYRTVCDNRIVWGRRDMGGLKIRHTSGAPERFLHEAAPALISYANSSAQEEIDMVRAAKSKVLASAAAAGRDADKKSILEWARARTNLDRSILTRAWDAAEQEEGEVRDVWGLVQGLTAAARTIPHTDARVAVETAAARLL